MQSSDRTPNGLLAQFQSQVALQMNAAAKLRVHAVDSEELAARYRQLAAEFNAIANTPLPQATHYAAGLKDEIARLRGHDEKDTAKSRARYKA